MPQEQIFWHEGLNYEVRSALQKPGFLATVENIVFEVDGKQLLRPSFNKVNSTSVGAVLSGVVFRGNLLIAYGGTLAWNAGSGDFNTLYSSFTNGAHWTFREYKEFIHGVNGHESIFFDVSGNLYPAQIDNPATAPTGADSGSGGYPSGVYKLYVSYFITWPNGMTYETGLSPGSADVIVASKKIAWSNIPVCPYAAYSGTAPTITRRLYRGPGTLGALAGIYFLDTIADNSTTTYTDNWTDAEAAAGGISDVADFGPLPNSRFLEYHYGRAFVVDVDKPWRLQYSEAATGADALENEIIMPTASGENDFDDVRVSGFQGLVDPQGIIAWGQNLYLALNQTWIRKEGNDATTWNYKKNYVSWGISAPYTMSLGSKPIGIYGLSLFGDGEPGLSIFNGQGIEFVAALRLRDLLKTDLNKAYIGNSFGKNVGVYYHLFYPSMDSTDGTPDTHLALDLTHYPDVRIGKWVDLNSTCIFINENNGDIFIGGSDGYVRKRSDTANETINVDVKTRDLIGGNIQYANMLKTLKKLHYNLNTNGATVKLEITIDGELMAWESGDTYRLISGTGDEVQYLESFPVSAEGYIYNLRIYGAVTTFELYSPWNLEFDATI